jgi:hypothetical protein
VICRPLYDAQKKDAFTWFDQQEKAFQLLKQAMLQPPVLALPDFSLPFVLEADASGQGIGTVLMQQGKPIAFYSKTLCKKAATMSTYDKEAVAILEALKKWKHYLASSSVIIRTDQQSLKYIHEQRLIDGIQHKLLIKLLGFNYVVEYKVADALCRASHAQSLAISCVVPVWIEQVTASYV